MPEVIQINGTRVYPGDSKNINLEIEKLPSHTLIDLPVYIFRGKEDGPVLLLTAGLHGDEVNGTETIRRMIRKKIIIPDKGSVIAIPIVNLYGFLHNSRSLPDGKDLNRSFPGSSRGSLASRLAYTIMRQILPHVDIGIDYHTGGASRTNYPQVRAVLEHGLNLELSKAFAPPLILNSKYIDKSFRKEAYKAGKTIVVYEGGESSRYDEFAIEQAMAGTQRVMHHLGMKTSKAKAPAFEPKILMHSSWIRAKSAGLFQPLLPYGKKVEKNELIAIITDPYGDMELKIKAPHPAYIVGLNNHPVVHAGDALIHLGYE